MPNLAIFFHYTHCLAFIVALPIERIQQITTARVADQAARKDLWVAEKWLSSSEEAQSASPSSSEEFA
jgi:hypothetical protein